MTQSELQEHGILIQEKDHYEGDIFLYTSKIYLFDNYLYISEEHSNQHRYTGENSVYHVVNDVRFALRRYNALWWSQIDIDEDALERLKERVKEEKSYD